MQQRTKRTCWDFQLAWVRLSDVKSLKEFFQFNHHSRIKKKKKNPTHHKAQPSMWVVLDRLFKKI